MRYVERLTGIMVGNLFRWISNLGDYWRCLKCISYSAIAQHESAYPFPMKRDDGTRRRVSRATSFSTQTAPSITPQPHHVSLLLGGVSVMIELLKQSHGSVAGRCRPPYCSGLRPTRSLADSTSPPVSCSAGGEKNEKNGPTAEKCATRYNRLIGDKNTTPSGSRGAGAARQ